MKISYSYLPFPKLRRENWKVSKFFPSVVTSYFQKNSTRWSKGKAFPGIQSVRELWFVSTVMSCAAFKGKMKQKSIWGRSYTLHIFRFPLLVGASVSFSRESQVSNMMETEAWTWLRGTLVFRYALHQKEMLSATMHEFAFHFPWQKSGKVMSVFSVCSHLFHLPSGWGQTSQCILHSFHTRLFSPSRLSSVRAGTVSNASVISNAQPYAGGRVGGQGCSR